MVHLVSFWDQGEAKLRLGWGIWEVLDPLQLKGHYMTSG